MSTYTHKTAPTQFVEAVGIRFAYRRFGAKVETLNPFEQVPLSGKSIDADMAAESASQFVVAVGLGTRNVGEPCFKLRRALPTQCGDYGLGDACAPRLVLS